MKSFKLGKVSYVMNLFWTAVSWQVFNVGCVGLIFKVSSLFSNVMCVLGLPVAPILAVIFLHESLNGLKAIAMLLAMWGFASSYAGFALILSVTQLIFRKMIKRDPLCAIIDMSIFSSLAATCAILIGLFASGDWRKLSSEMESFKLGEVSYVMNLFSTAVSWQVFNVGCVGLIFKVSSLFSNVMSVLGLPVAPILAVIFLHESLNGLKAIAMLLAMWGFASCMCQHYLGFLMI
ncbi:unnamed protein product [Fraxinus pennsylvanica]|uniref:Purine permease n=1 Tax=Fraxinus pennsylvanica TaxID=56036 RepID=A0AAD1YPL3_9LAMI|nr:unnamed protein product [Fraxinus pennsylvanica]